MKKAKPLSVTGTEKTGWKSRPGRIVKIILVAVVACVLLLGAMVAGDGYAFYKETVREKDIGQTVENLRAQEGFTALSDLPTDYLDAVIAVEDHRFYRHGAIDIISIGGALWRDIKARKIVAGGSTITQQVAKNLFLTQEQRLRRKVAEIFLAFELERRFSKEEILELYVNCIYFGSGYVGVRDAAEGYFGIAPCDMNLDESTTLAGIPNAPSAYSLDTDPELAQQRQDDVIRQMVKYGYLTEDEADSLGEDWRE